MAEDHRELWEESTYPTEAELPHGQAFIINSIPGIAWLASLAGRRDVADAVYDASCVWEPGADPSPSPGLLRTWGASLYIRTPARAVAFPLGVCPRPATPVWCPVTGLTRAAGAQPVVGLEPWCQVDGELSPGQAGDPCAKPAPAAQAQSLPGGTAPGPDPRPLLGGGRPLFFSLVLSPHEAGVRLIGAASVSATLTRSQGRGLGVPLSWADHPLRTPSLLLSPKHRLDGVDADISPAARENG